MSDSEWTRDEQGRLCKIYCSVRVRVQRMQTVAGEAGGYKVYNYRLFGYWPKWGLNQIVCDTPFVSEEAAMQFVDNLISEGERGG